MINILNKKQKERFNNFLEENYNIEIKGQIIKQSNNKLRIFTGNLSEHELNILMGTVRVETIGLYLAKIDDKNPENIRFSFDASFLAKNVKKNVLEVNDFQATEWFKGNDIEIESNTHTPYTYQYIFLKYKDEIVGCGKIAENKILNFVPKERRIKN
jgi:NOL1/NOP2/fmu family ribosome biogenesis protein